jgi:hypothetical protein
MRSHGCDEPSVVGDAAVTSVGHDQDFPFREPSRLIRKEAEQTVHPSDLNLTLGDRQTEPIGSDPSRGRGPELVEVL